MANKYTPYTTEQKVAYGKKFSEKERNSYRKGKRNGFLAGVHAPRKTDNLKIEDIF